MPSGRPTTLNKLGASAPFFVPIDTSYMSPRAYACAWQGPGSEVQAPLKLYIRGQDALYKNHGKAECLSHRINGVIK